MFCQSGWATSILKLDVVKNILNTQTMTTKLGTTATFQAGLKADVAQSPSSPTEVSSLIYSQSREKKPFVK